MTNPPRLYLIGWVAAITLAFAPLLYSQNVKQYIDFLPAILAIIVPMIIEQYNNNVHRSSLERELLSENEKLRLAVTTECQRAITGAQVITVLSVGDAHRYVAMNAKQAKRIFNTRLANSNFEHISPQYMAARNLQDDGFLQAIENGAEYNLIYDISQERDVRSFLNRVPRSTDERQVGIVHASRVDARGMPLMQFIVLEHEGYNECLLGYGVGHEIATTHEIYLIRSNIICSYLRHVHDEFIRILSVRVV